MSIIIVILIVFIGVWIRYILEDIVCNIKDIQEIKPICKLHKWVTNEELNKLVCEDCGFISG